MTTKWWPNRQTQILFSISLSSLLVLGTLRVILDEMRSDSSQFLQIVLRLPINISKEELIEEGCNVFEGKWVLDNTTYYTEESCPSLVKQVTCQKNGRPDSLYKNWRWQPSSCNLPRLNPLKLLEMLRNKRMMFVGDSIQRGMFDSLVCMVQSVIPQGKMSLKRIPPRKIFIAEEFNASIEYFWAPFIVESNSDNALNHTVKKRLVKLGSISNHGKLWEDVDILIFESYIWWMYKPLINATYGYPTNVREYNVTTAYRLALETWADWINTSINESRQKVYFMSMSPTHLWSWEWRHGSNGNCFNESSPIHDSWYRGSGSNAEIMEILSFW